MKGADEEQMPDKSCELPQVYTYEFLDHCRKGNDAILDQLFSDDAVFTEQQDCFDSDSSCGYCDDCCPPDAVVESICWNNMNVLQKLLSRNDLPIRRLEALSAAADQEDKGYLELLINDSRFYPKDDPRELLSTICCIPGRTQWKFTCRDEVLALPEELVLQRKNSSISNDNWFVFQWETFKRLKHEGKLSQNHVPQEYRISTQDLYDQTFCYITSWEISPCIGWVGRKENACYHMYKFIQANGEIRCSGKASIKDILYRAGDFPEECLNDIRNAGGACELAYASNRKH